jgi:hypothetical protein
MNVNNPIGGPKIYEINVGLRAMGSCTVLLWHASRERQRRDVDYPAAVSFYSRVEDPWR